MLSHMDQGIQEGVLCEHLAAAHMTVSSNKRATLFRLPPGSAALHCPCAAVHTCTHHTTPALKAVPRLHYTRCTRELGDHNKKRLQYSDQRHKGKGASK
jgi:hypothetical protein